MRTFKLERILSAELTDTRYQVPEGFDPTALLESAWGIMFGEEREEVALRFAPSAVRRVKETHWHPSQELEDLPDGGCLLRVRVANPQEMLYWIRGWGPAGGGVGAGGVAGAGAAGGVGGGADREHHDSNGTVDSKRIGRMLLCTTRSAAPRGGERGAV